MTKELWINLPVKNVQKAQEFFIAIGFSANPDMSGGDSFTCVLFGDKKIPVMLFENSKLSEVMMSELTDTSKSSEMIITFDAESKQEVDELAQKVTQAGGEVFSEPAPIQGVMYGCAFTDLDGHRWNVLYRG